MCVKFDIIDDDDDDGDDGDDGDGGGAWWWNDKLQTVECRYPKIIDFDIVGGGLKTGEMMLSSALAVKQNLVFDRYILALVWKKLWRSKIETNDHYTPRT